MLYRLCILLACTLLTVDRAEAAGTKPKKTGGNEFANVDA